MICLTPCCVRIFWVLWGLHTLSTEAGQSEFEVASGESSQINLPVAAPSLDQINLVSSTFCSCPSSGSRWGILDAYERNSHALSVYVEKQVNGFRSDKYTIFKAQIRRIFKGCIRVKSRVMIAAETDSNCGLDLSVQQMYLILGTPEKILSEENYGLHTFVVSKCSFVKEWEVVLRQEADFLLSRQICCFNTNGTVDDTDESEYEVEGRQIKTPMAGDTDSTTEINKGTKKSESKRLTCLCSHKRPTVECPVLPCSRSICEVPGAVCKNNICGSCQAEWTTIEKEGTTEAHTVPVCQACEYHYKLHPHGSTFKAADGCNLCKCEAGRVFCTSEQCASCDVLNKVYKRSYRPPSKCDDKMDRVYCGAKSKAKFNDKCGCGCQLNLSETISRNQLKFDPSLIMNEEA